MDSPRGRIYLMRQGLEGEPMSDTMVQHFDRCLGCLACVTACPSGVQYDVLIEATRQQVERRFPRTLGERFFRELIYTFLPHPRRLQILTAPVQLYQRTGMRRALRRTGVFKRLPARLRSMEELIPDIPGHRESVQAWTPSAGTERLRVGMLLGCVQRALFSDVNAATVRVLSADGCTVSAPLSQGCCGALSEHVGREKEALAFARKTIDVFESAGVDAVVVNVAGCGSMMKRYGDLLADDPAYAERARHFADKVRDASELLEELGPQAERHPLPVTAVYHDACHLAHGQQITRQPRASLRRIPDLVLREVPRERDICCGSAGTYNLLEPDAGRELGERKARNILDADAQLLVTANPGCHLQIEASLRRMGKSLPAVHVMQAVDASIRGDPVASLTHQVST
jgi:glycolate oxidase iron-sulfur subunit